MAAQACRAEAERVHSVMLRRSKTMTTVAAQSQRNGVDVAKLFATLDAVKAHPEAASFRFGVTNRKIYLESVESRVEGDIDLRGILGLSDEVRNGFSQIQVSFRVRGDASPEALRQLVQQAVARSAVYDVLTHGVPISVDV